jgi:WxL domain surface cell wall-binding
MNTIARIVKNPRSRAAAVAAAAVAALAGPLAAFGGTSTDVTATATVNPGTLALSSSATPSVSVTLDGTDKTPTYSLPFTVSDPRGTGAGWNITVTSTTFTTGSKSLATNASAVTAVSSACSGGTTCTNASSSVGLPVTVPAGSTAPAAVMFFDSALNSGMGEVVVTPTVQVSVPASTFAGTYTSTVTLAVASGP